MLAGVPASEAQISMAAVQGEKPISRRLTGALASLEASQAARKSSCVRVASDQEFSAVVATHVFQMRRVRPRDRHIHCFRKFSCQYYKRFYSIRSSVHGEGTRREGTFRRTRSVCFAPFGIMKFGRMHTSARIPSLITELTNRPQAEASSDASQEESDVEKHSSELEAVVDRSNILDGEIAALQRCVQRSGRILAKAKEDDECRRHSVQPKGTGSGRGGVPACYPCARPRQLAVGAEAPAAGGRKTRKCDWRSVKGDDIQSPFCSSPLLMLRASHPTLPINRHGSG